MPMCFAIEEIFELDGIDEVSVMGEGDTVSWFYIKRQLCLWSLHPPAQQVSLLNAFHEKVMS